jgi:hypothetical protein
MRSGGPVCRRSRMIEMRQQSDRSSPLPGRYPRTGRNGNGQPEPVPTALVVRRGFPSTGLRPESYSKRPARFKPHAAPGPPPSARRNINPCGLPGKLNPLLPTSCQENSGRAPARPPRAPKGLGLRRNQPARCGNAASTFLSNAFPGFAKRVSKIIAAITYGLCWAS